MSSQDTACNLDFIMIAAQGHKAGGGWVRKKVEGCLRRMDHSGTCCVMVEKEKVPAA